MILSAPRVAPYLLEIGLLVHSTIVSGNVSISQIQRRNNNFLVSIQDEGGLFIKQPLSDTQSDRQTIERESLWYQMIQFDNSHPLHAHVPKIKAYDTPNAIMILERIEAQPASELQRSKLSHSLAKKLGNLLGQWHHHSGLSGYEALPDGLKTRVLPHAFEIPAMTRSAHPSNRALAQLSKILDDNPDLCERLQNLKRMWAPDSCIHTDLRLDNILFSNTAEGAPYLIDLELMSWGDSLWDTAYCLHNYLLRWLMAIPIPSDASSVDIHEAGAAGLRELHGIAPVFWSHYLDARSESADLMDKSWEKLASYVALALLQSAYEHSVQQPQITTHAVYLLQLCENALMQPRQFLQSMLNLDLSS